MHLSADWAGEAITWLNSRNVKTRPLLDALELRRADLEFGQQIPAHAFAAILDYGAVETRDTEFGLHRGADFDVKRGGVLAYLAASAETVGDAIASFQRYAVVVCDGFALEVEPMRDGAELLLQVSDPVWRSCRHLGDFVAARLIGGLRRLSGLDFDPLEVRFMHSRPAALAAYRSFFRCGIGHDSRGDMIKLSDATLQIRIPSADSRLGRMVQTHADQLLHQARGKRSHSLEEDVVAIIKRRLPARKAALRDVAAQLHLSERTLRRRLGESEVKFGDLVDRVRLELADRWLAETEYDLKHISFLLGYSEPAAFSRAYKRWTGRSPGRARAA